jgi:ribA/ribD-fused uncharacterized protein
MDTRDIEVIKKAEEDAVVTRGNVTLFWGGWASQWYPSRFVLEDTEFNCAEQWMMWSKARFLGDAVAQEAILKAKWPKAQKELARKAGPWNPEWDAPEGSRTVVLRGNMAKFRQDSVLLHALLATGDTLIGEASPFDDRWGIGMRMSRQGAWRPSEWTGTNWLGKALMQVRTLLRDER